MANILHRTTKELLKSVNTPDYVPGWRKGQPAPSDGDWIVNPDLSAVDGLDPRYWKITGNTVEAMDEAERAVADAEHEAVTLAEAKAIAIANLDSDLVAKAIAQVVGDLGVKSGAEVIADIKTAIAEG